MAFSFRKTYRPDIEQLLRQYSQSLSEKDRRRFAALEAITLGHSGTRSIAKVLGCDPQTVKDGMRELKQLPDDPAGRRVRKPGGGRKKTEVKQEHLIQQVQDTIKNRTAGDPMRPDVVWTDLTPQGVARRRLAASRRTVSPYRTSHPRVPGGRQPNLEHRYQEERVLGHPVPRWQSVLSTGAQSV